MSAALKYRFPLRLTARQLQLLNAGLRTVAWASSRHLYETNDDPNRCSCPFCEFHNEVAALVVSVKEASAIGCNVRHRERFDIVQVLICQVAIRNVLHPTKILRRVFGPISTTGRDKKLCSKLENLRKRARRQYARENGADGYAELCKTWSEYLSCLRQTLSGRMPWYLARHKKGTPRPTALLVDSLIRSVSRELGAAQTKLIRAEELRKLTRLFLRYARRGRLDVWILDCAHNPDHFARQLAAFIKTHIHQKPNHNIGGN